MFYLSVDRKCVGLLLFIQDTGERRHEKVLVGLHQKQEIRCGDFVFLFIRRGSNRRCLCSPKRFKTNWSRCDESVDSQL